LAEYLIGLCTGKDRYNSASFDGTKFPVNGARNGVSTDFNWEEFYDTDRLQLQIKGTAARFAELGRPNPYGAQSAALHWLWAKARSEWAPNKHRGNGRAGF
jgi:hypothetical protein